MPTQLTRTLVLFSLALILTACKTRAVDTENADASAIPLPAAEDVSTTPIASEELAAPAPFPAFEEAQAQAEKAVSKKKSRHLTKKHKAKRGHMARRPTSLRKKISRMAARQPAAVREEVKELAVAGQVGVGNGPSDMQPPQDPPGVEMTISVNPLESQALPVPDPQTDLQASTGKGFDWVFWAFVAVGAAIVITVVRIIRGRKPRSLVYHS